MRRYGLWVGWTAVAITWAAGSIVLLRRVPTGGSDFSIFLAAGRALRFNPHADIYQLGILRAALHSNGDCSALGTRCATSCNIWGLPYVYQPLLAILLEPLSALSCTQAWVIWQLFNVILWAGGVALLVLPEAHEHPWRAIVMAALSVTFLPLLQGLVIGQVHIIMLATCLAASALVERHRPYAAGGLLAFGAFVKYLPGFLVLYYLLTRQWRVAASTFVVGGGLAIAEILIAGAQTVLTSFGAGAAATEAQSHGLWVTAIPGGVLVAAFVGGGFVLGTLWTSREGKGNERLGMGWALCTMLLVSPFVHWFYLTLLLPAFVACLGAALDDASRQLLRRHLTRWSRWIPLVPLGLAYVLILVRMVAVTYTDQAGVVATLILWSLCGAYYLRSAGARLPIREAPLWRTAKVHRRGY